MATDEQIAFAINHALDRGARYANPEAVLRAIRRISPEYTFTLPSVKKTLGRLRQGKVITSATRDIAKIPD